MVHVCTLFSLSNIILIGTSESSQAAGATSSSSLGGATTPSSSVNEEMRKSKKRKASGSVPSTDASVIQTSMQEASNALKALTQRNVTSETPPDVQGFLMTLGADLSSIQDMRKRRLLMMEVQSLVLSCMYPESASNQPANVSRPTSAPPERYESQTARENPHRPSAAQPAGWVAPEANFSYSNYLNM